MFNKLQQYLFLSLAICLLAACGGRNSAQTESGNYDILIEAGSTDVGKTDLMITLQDNAGNPVNDATVSIKGDMSHAGMQPVLGESSSATNGVYTIPYEWTMAGDWFVTIDVNFADGTSTFERFEFNNIGVSGDAIEGHGKMDMEESDE